MRVGVPREVKDNENRVGLTPDGAAALVMEGHEVVIERGAGAGCGFADSAYEAAGAAIGSAKEAWASTLVIKVKEPLESEYTFLGGQILLTYLHLAGAEGSLTHALLDAGTTAIAYETVEDENGRLPLLAPMSAVAGSMAPLMGSYYLAKFNGGRGTLIGEILGEPHGKVVIVGDGIVGRHAAKVAGAMGARSVVLFGLNPERAGEFERSIPRLRYEFSTPEALAPELSDTDLLVGAVLILGARAPRVVTADMVRSMPEGSVIVDVSIDQGGCIETSRPTSHSDPVFVEHGVTHYCVTNMPGAFPRTSTLALTAATLPYVLRIANGGIDAVLEDPGFVKGINMRGGRITCKPVAEALGLERLYADVRGR
ncbi:MAG TPA: alanine dehydrogenase [Gammaproteobacteria bacterium]|nr:alanine dehydrogenase [Gammaproteobacteria bacterium]